jgi:hypothetical protein
MLQRYIFFTTRASDFIVIFSTNRTPDLAREGLFGTSLFQINIRAHAYRFSPQAYAYFHVRRGGEPAASIRPAGPSRGAPCRRRPPNRGGAGWCLRVRPGAKASDECGGMVGVCGGERKGEYER